MDDVIHRDSKRHDTLQQIMAGADAELTAGENSGRQRTQQRQQQRQSQGRQPQQQQQRRQPAPVRAEPQDGDSDLEDDDPRYAHIGDYEVAVAIADDEGQL